MPNPRHSRHAALTAAREILAVLTPACEAGRVIVAGSLRRRKQWVGDVEILYIGRMENRPVPGDMFQFRDFNLADLAIQQLEKAGVLEKRESTIGSVMYGPKNKLMRHVASGVPVDLFATCETSWFNYLVCRTGPKESNVAIASRAKAKGWNWNPYGSGFTTQDGRDAFEVKAEKDVFEFTGLPWREPQDR